jgi:hypothetical protein
VRPEEIVTMNAGSGKLVGIFKKVLFDKGKKGNLFCSAGGSIGLIAQIFPLLVKNAPAGYSHTCSTSYIYNFAQTGGGSWPFAVALLIPIGISFVALITGPSRVMTILASISLIALWSVIVFIIPMSPANLGPAVYITSGSLLMIAAGIVRI